MIIYPDLIILREFYSYYVQKQIEEKNEVVLINPFYETEHSVRLALLNSHRAINVEKHEAQQTLMINDSLKEYFTEEPPMDSKKRLINQAIRMDKKGLSVIADMGSFCFQMSCDKLVDYELSLPIHFDMALKGHCIYHQKDFDNRLILKQQKDLVKHHSVVFVLKPD